MPSIGAPQRGHVASRGTVRIDGVPFAVITGTGASSAGSGHPGAVLRGQLAQTRRLSIRPAIAHCPAEKWMQVVITTAPERR